MRYLRPLLTLIILTLLFGASLQGVRAETTEKVLTVATRHVPPFAIRNEDGGWEGISINLWKEIAASLGLQYQLQEMGLQEMLRAVQHGQADAAVAALTITSERERNLDFSHPFLSAGLGIAVPRSGDGGWLAVGTRLVSGPFLTLVGGLLGLLLLVGLAVWLFERRRNAQFGGNPAQGIGSGLWWSAVTMTTVGYGDKAPKSIGGRAIAMVWMFASVIITSSFTAAITTTLTVGELSDRIKGPKDLIHSRVLTLAGSTSEQYLTDRRQSHQNLPDLPSALQQLAEGKADAVVYDAPILRYLVLKGYADSLKVLPDSFEKQDYGIAFPSGSRLREAVNRELLKRLHDSSWQDILYRYLGSRS